VKRRLRVIDGTLDVGEVRASPLVRAVVAQADPGDGLTVVDAPPGTSCAAVAAVEGADLTLLIAEPTPFGQHDLELALDLCDALGQRTAAVINRADLGNGEVRERLSRRGVPLLAEVAFDRGIAAACAGGSLAVGRVPAFASTISDLANSVLRLAGGPIR
jgi:MinD superfamily P-loop ATPase